MDDEPCEWQYQSNPLSAAAYLVVRFDPGIKITFADAADIDACMPSVAPVGPTNDVPQLIRGEKVFY